MKKSLAMVLCFAMLFVGGAVAITALEENSKGGETVISEWDGIVPSYDMNYGFSGGDGGKYTPYLISSAKDLALLAANVRGERKAGIDGMQFNTYKGKHFKLTVDIDLKNHEWYGIGGAMPVTGFTEYSYFAGIFDGDYHKIYNLNLAFYDESLKQTLNFQGLFGYIGYGAELRNLGIAGGHVNDVNEYRVTRVGCLVGGVRNDAIIENCYNNADMTLCGMGGAPNYIGGLIGTWMDSANTRILRNCYNTGDVSVVVNNIQFRIGGVVGGMLGAGPAGCTYVIENCFNTGKISVKDTVKDLSSLVAGKEGTRSVAGISGALLDGISMINCHTSGGVEYSYVNPEGAVSSLYYCRAFSGLVNGPMKNCTAVPVNGIALLGRNQSSSSSGVCREATSIPFYTMDNGFLDTRETVTCDSGASLVKFQNKIGAERQYNRLSVTESTPLRFDFESNKTKQNFGLSLKLTDPFGIRITARMTDRKGAPSTYASYLSGIDYGFFVVRATDGVALEVPEQVIASEKVEIVDGNMYGDTGYYYADLGGIAAHQLNTQFYIVAYYISEGEICLSDVVTVDLAKTLEAYAAEGNPYGFAEKEYNVYVTMLAYCKQYAQYAGA